MGLDRESELCCSAGLLQSAGEEELQWARLRGLLPRLQHTQVQSSAGQTSGVRLMSVLCAGRAEGGTAGDPAGRHHPHPQPAGQAGHHPRPLPHLTSPQLLTIILVINICKCREDIQKSACDYPEQPPS